MNTDGMSFVSLFFTEQFFRYVCDQTNLYASQVISAALRLFTKYSLVQTWVLVTVSELKNFFGTNVCKWGN
jgi:hypothetical protein